MPRPFHSGGRYRGRPRPQRGPRCNERIYAREVRLLDPEGKQIGIVSTADALRQAKSQRLDLVEISANTRPPVCRILDYGKYMYALSKKNKNKAKSSAHKVKEIKLRMNIEQHDYLTKLRRGEEFLNQGNKLKLSLLFRGRENEHRHLGFDLMKRAVKDLEHVGHPDSDPHMVGRCLTMTLSPLPEGKRNLKYNEGKKSDTQGN